MSIGPRAGLGLLLSLLAACGEGAAPGSSESGAEPGPGILLVTVDTLRADHLGFGGYERATSPRLDTLAESSLVFTDAHATSSWTLPSLVSLMTALEPRSHGCVANDTALPGGAPTLAERLAESGWFTGAVVSQAFAGERYGLDRGFADFDDELAELNRGRELFKKTSAEVSDKACRWLAARALEDERPWFLWLHYFDPHHAYVPHPGVSESFGTDAPLDLYDGEIAWTDRQIGRVLDTLDELGLAPRTIVAFTADHGEEFGDHGGLYHRRTLHREVVHVPLLLSVPGRAPAREPRLASLVDVAPTLLALVDAEPLGATHGRDLLSGAPRERVTADLLRDDGTRLFAAIEPTRTWIDTGAELLAFDRGADLTEQRPLALAPDRVREVRAELDRLRADSERLAERAGPPLPVDLGEDDLRALRALGYVADED